MNFYIDKEGTLSKFEKYPMVTEKFEIARKNLNLFSLQQAASTVQDFSTCSHILFLHPSLKGTIGEVATSIYCMRKLMGLDELYEFIKNNDCYLVVCEIVHSSFRTHLSVLILENVEYESCVRKFYIDEFIENN